MANEYDQYTQNSGGKLFNSAMFGFNKEEVLEYLEEMAEENYQRQESSEQRIRELTAQVQQLQANAASHQHQNAQSDGMLEEERRAFDDTKKQLEQALIANQRTDAELQQYKDQLFNMQKENAWLREEYQKSDDVINDLRQQLEEIADGQWPTVDQQQLQELKGQLEQTETTLAQTQEALRQSDELRAQTEQALQDTHAQLAEGQRSEEETSRARQAAEIIIDEANEEARRIRQEALDQKERLQRQLQGSAGGLMTSISTLRTEVTGVEGDVTKVLETVQGALAELLASLGRTEQHLSTLDTQVDRFPASAPALQKPQQQVVYFQPGNELETEQSRRTNTNWRAPQPQSLGSGGFRRVWPDGSQGKNTPARPFRPTYTTSPGRAAYAAGSNEAYQLAEGSPDERMRNLAESLVDTLMQMMN